MVQKVAKSIGVEAKIIKGLSPISSTQIRVDQQIRSRDTPPAVSNYILQNNLYP
jgi:nicotinic acid mononucleotide adenylyltransferase